MAKRLIFSSKWLRSIGKAPKICAEKLLLHPSSQASYFDSPATSRKTAAKGRGHMISYDFIGFHRISDLDLKENVIFCGEELSVLKC